MPKVPVPNPVEPGVVPKPKFVFVGLNNEDVGAVEVPKVFVVPKLAPNPVLGVAPKPEVAGFAPKRFAFVGVFVPNEKPEVVVAPRLKLLAGLLANKPID